MSIFKRIFGDKPKETTQINLGWVKDELDERDYKFIFSKKEKLPSNVDMRDLYPPVYNQGGLGSCTANAVGAAFQFCQIRQNQPNFMPSRLFIYYNERVLLGWEDIDSGATIRSGMKTLANDGVCPETMWEYNIKKFKDKPTDDCYIEAKKHQLFAYFKISTDKKYYIKKSLSDGYPVVFGFNVYQSFINGNVKNTGIAKLPKRNWFFLKNRDKLLGGHAVVAVGYDDKKNALIVRNSWGSYWGLNGYFYLPYRYLKVKRDGYNLSDSFWTTRFVE